MVLSRDEIQRMEHGARTERDKLIIRLLADTGLRVGDLLGLRANDLVEQNHNYYVHVRGKGSIDRLVPAPRLYRRLRVHIERGRPRDAVREQLENVLEARDISPSASGSPRLRGHRSALTSLTTGF